MSRVDKRVVTTALLSAALLALGDMPPVVTGDPLLTPFALAGAAEAGNYDPAVARVVQSLVEYTRWPSPRNPLRLCVAGPALYAGRLDGLRLADGRLIERRTLPPGAVTAGACDAVYIGQLAPPAQRQLTTVLRGRGVMTVAEADPACRSQAMFCLSFSAQAVSFRLNVDAVARSGLRVDPRVLRLSTGGQP
ncbi:YfiR family protein [Novosphingobium ginsenosidimutans]|uniref:YfiR family protein n=1 Tax=Novosphingobium ginsenosidimutans TaxID=1176536 RepID=A0A5B8S6T0_9SPHN|nr:YfiR family protein [Novosphingobium ginsenosidimutans]QEA16367.1 YfiR family protein [Novosphingobium ginsenosidimutans]